MSTTAKTVKWTKRGRKRFHEQLIYISNNNCRDEAARWALRVIRVTRTLNDFPLYPGALSLKSTVQKSENTSLTGISA